MPDSRMIIDGVPWYFSSGIIIILIYVCMYVCMYVCIIFNFSIIIPNIYLLGHSSILVY